MIKKRTCQIYFKREGGHHTYFVDRGNNWGGDTAHPPNTFYTLSRLPPDTQSDPVVMCLCCECWIWITKFRWRLGGWVAGWVIIVPLCGFILQAETCQILSLAENPRWSPSVAIQMVNFFGTSVSKCSQLLPSGIKCYQMVASLSKL